jgi:hypothetical protein
VPTRSGVLRLLAAGHTYETAARELRISPALAYMIATGRPADSSAAGAGDPGSQRLTNPPTFTPAHEAVVVEWVRARARRELSAPR